jgi:hypothetical protein
MTKKRSYPSRRSCCDPTPWPALRDLPVAVRLPERAVGTNLFAKSSSPGAPRPAPAARKPDLWARRLPSATTCGPRGAWELHCT